MPPVDSVSAAQPPGAHGSTWYCAGGDTVVVANSTGERVNGRITVYGGDIAAPAPPDPAVSIPDAPGPALSTDPAGDVPTDSAPRGMAGERMMTMTALPDDQAETPPAGETFVLAARGRRQFRPGDQGGGGSLAGAVVELDGGGGVAVEQRIDRPAGSDTAPCASVTARDWHFAWGTTAREARELLVLFNPFLNDVTVDATFSTNSGVREPVRWQGLVVPAGRVLGVDLGQDVTRREQVSASIRSRRGGLVVSRVQSFDGSGGTGGVSLTVGQPEPARRWTFAHGRIDDHTGERIVLYNPGDRAAEVDVALAGFGTDVPPPQPFGVVVRPGRFEIVDYSEERRVAPEEPHATVVRSTNGVPVVAERVLTFAEDAGSGTDASDDAPTQAECHGIPTPAAAPPGDGNTTAGDDAVEREGASGSDEAVEGGGDLRRDGGAAGDRAGDSGTEEGGEVAAGSDRRDGAGDARADEDGEAVTDERGDGQGAEDGEAATDHHRDGQGAEDGEAATDDRGEGDGADVGSVNGGVGDPGDEPAPACGIGEVSAVAGVPAGARTWVFAGAASGDAGDGDGTGGDDDGGHGSGGEDDGGDDENDGDDDGGGGGVRLTVLNPHPRRDVRVSVAVDVEGARWRPAELQDAVVGPDSRVTWPLRDLPASANLVVESDRPVVVERTLIRDHRVTALAPGIPVP